tara:strand:- start:6009 stop:6215 length:207 start_codon:yes stop_codon:yes gene_type:complete
MSKGDTPRPLSVSYKEYSDNYEAIFGRKDQEPKYLNEITEEEEIQAEKRMDIIGQNGNEGTHYDEVDG